MLVVTQRYKFVAMVGSNTMDVALQVAALQLAMDTTL
jgi:hypothetical protein